MLSEEEIMCKEAFDELINNLEIVEKLTLYGKKSIKYWVTKLQKENEEKDKQIDLMAEYINEIDVSEDICEGRTMCDEDCEKCIKQYFVDLVEKE